MSTNKVSQEARQRIVSAAIELNGAIYIGNNHAAILHSSERPRGFLKFGEQGFITDAGKFVDRREAYLIALNAGQVRKKRMEYLDSEDINEK